ncbi:MAG: fructose-1,6-bisphosphatase [Hominimerdicola sp.]
MENKYLQLLAKEYPTISSVASEMVNLSAIRSLPKGTEYFFSDLHGEYESFLHMLKSASGTIKRKIDIAFGKTLTNAVREDLASLIYYPDKVIKKLEKNGEITDEWRRLTIYRLIQVCEVVSAKYTRERVRNCVTSDLSYILDELMNVTDDINKDFYYDEIINTILDTQIAESFIISLCNLIQCLSIDKLHIIGDIFDRGPRPDIILDHLIQMEDVDVQWGNHDISWMGAAAGNMALMANVIRIGMRYNNFDVLEDGYGLNLRPLAVFANEVYKDDPCENYKPSTLDDNIYDPVDINLASKMHKAITIIQLKLEGQLIEKHSEWEMAEREMLRNTDFAKGTVRINGQDYKLNDTNFPTIDSENPLELTKEEQELMTVLANSFMHSEKLHKHIKFLFSKGSMYKVCNGNLLFHGCIPMDEKGELQEVTINGKKFKGKDLLDRIDVLVDRAYFGKKNTDEGEYACDFMWYLWCGAKSPLYGKDKMAFFERYFLDEKELHKESYNSYYQFSERETTCRLILSMFGINPDKGHIINGHVPVKIKDGESPVKAGGKLFVIDGGISKAYQKTTGIAGYTLIYDSHTLSLAEHKPFVAGESEHTPQIYVVEKMENRVNISDTDRGEEILDKIGDLRELLDAYRSGTIKEQ